MNRKQRDFENDEARSGCKMLAKSPETIKNAQNIKNNYTKYSNTKLDQTQYIVAQIENEW